MRDADIGSVRQCLKDDKPPLAETIPTTMPPETAAAPIERFTNAIHSPSGAIPILLDQAIAAPPSTLRAKATPPVRNSVRT